MGGGAEVRKEWRNYKALLGAAALAFAASCGTAALSAQAINIPQTKPTFQSPGVHMTISAVASKKEPALVTGIDLKIRNSGTIDVLLNLGDKIGAKEYPSAVRWTLTGPREQTMELVHCWNERAGDAGRIDDLVMVLPPGTSYAARMMFGPYCYTVPGYTKPAPGHYRIEASFTGRRQQHADPGMKLPPLMEFWMGSMVSNSIDFTVGPQTF